MEVSEFLGKKVLDKTANEVGKITDMTVKPIEGLITNITISEGEIPPWIKSFKVKPDELDKIGDYVLLKIDQQEIEKRTNQSKKKESGKTKLEIKED
ncbi:MAG: PRC-barrel domain-containing protein [Methanobacteriaceae archaeon]|nr:PRC-barrel domain-containing protein [Methanobacteriaceae archaeon]